MIRKSRPKNRRPYQRGVKVAEHKINEHIMAPEIRLVGNDVETGVYPTSKALQIAHNMGLDLVEISPKAQPPVCKVIDYSKFLYEQRKKKKEIKSGAKQVITKEIRFGPNTEQHDFDFKLKHATKFLTAGDRVRAFVHFKGRTIVYKEKGELLLLRFAKELEEYGRVEQMPHLEGKRMFTIIVPKNTSKK